MWKYEIPRFLLFPKHKLEVENSSNDPTVQYEKAGIKINVGNSLTVFNVTLIPIEAHIVMKAWNKENSFKTL